MDRVVAGIVAEDRDLLLLPRDGMAFQRGVAVTASYDRDYFDKYLSYEGSEIAARINAGRVALVNKHVGNAGVLDVGIGSGEFIRSRPNTYGRDVNPVAVAWLQERCLWGEFESFRAFTFWDVIEHVPCPQDYFDRIAPGSFLFTSIPLFHDLKRIRDSKHYRPGEHLYYWTREGLLRWMEAYGFQMVDEQDFEIKAGRDSIYSFAFRRP